MTPTGIRENGYRKSPFELEYFGVQGKKYQVQTKYVKCLKKILDIMNYFGSVSAFLVLTRLEKNMEAVDGAQRDFLNFGAISILLM